MKFETISPKQAEIFKFMAEPYDALICDGAVRSGKTTMMTIAFIEWAMACFDGESFGICGKTVRSAERNIIAPLMGIDSIRKKYSINYSRSTSLLTIRTLEKTNYFYVFGGKDESSYMLIQGITLSGVLFDEVALMPQSFVDQGIARTLSVDEAKLWFNCNPENPNHWFYKEWVKQPETHNAKHLHFTMEDNPSLTGKALERAKRSFTGVFYDRYVRGLWVAAEGAIYSQFANDPEAYIVDDSDTIFSVIGVDFGGNASAHAFTCTGFKRHLKGVVTLDEFYTKDPITPTELEDEFVKFVKKQITGKRNVLEVRADSAEQVLIRGLRNALTRAGIGIPIRNAIKGEITERIKLMNMLISFGWYHISKDCKYTIDALKDAVYDPKKHDDTRLDNGTSNIDSLDALEYTIEPYQKQLIDMMLVKE